MISRQGATVASAVALMLSAAGCTNDTSEGEGDDIDQSAAALKCQGINECAGTSECASPDGSNDCQGLNECKGMGWVSVDSEGECTSEGGTIIS